MIPTLFGVTIVAFVIMQLAPGDPLKKELGAGGAMGESSETREAYLVRRRDLKLDRPLLLNFRYFYDYSDQIEVAAHYRGMTEEEIAAELDRLAARPDEPVHARRLDCLRDLGIEQFDRFLGDRDLHKRLAVKVQAAVQVYCEDVGHWAAPAAMAILQDPAAGIERKIGAIRCLNLLVVEPFTFTYPRDADPAQTAEVQAPWRLWWERNRKSFPQLDEDQRAYVRRRFEAMVEAGSRAEVFADLENFDRPEMRYFIERLLDEQSRLEAKVIAAAGLKLYIGQPLRLDVPRDASPELVTEVAENWLLNRQVYTSRYDPWLPKKLWDVVADTQYAHMVWRLLTFDFGRSATKTREPVAEKIIDAVLVSAPLMIMAELVIYILAVPLGIVCAVNRANPIDRSISLGLFLLYSIPPFVAGMLFLLFLCYGVFLDWFPALGLHSPGAESFGWVQYLTDYLWHAFLPVVCLSLFSLAAMAMYSRTAMLDVIGQDFIRTARAKGLSEGKVIFKHGLRNALIPIITLFAGFLPAMLGGSVLIEWLFGIPGMGRLSWDSIEQKDFPTLMALVYIDAIVVMLSILLTDLLYVFVDPRISFEGQEQAG